MPGFRRHARCLVLAWLRPGHAGSAAAGCWRSLRQCRIFVVFYPSTSLLLYVLYSRCLEARCCVLAAVVWELPHLPRSRPVWRAHLPVLDASRQRSDPTRVRQDKCRVQQAPQRPRVGVPCVLEPVRPALPCVRLAGRQRVATLNRTLSGAPFSQVIAGNAKVNAAKSLRTPLRMLADAPALGAIYWPPPRVPRAGGDLQRRWAWKKRGR